MDLDQNIKEEISKFWDFLDEENIEKADEISDKLLIKQPENAHIHYIKGHVEFKKNEFKESIKSFEEALERSKDERLSSFTNYWIGEVYDHNTGDILSENENEIFDSEKAEKYFLRSVSFNEFPSNVVDKLGSYFRENPEEALKIIPESIKKYPEEIDYYIKLSYVYKLTYEDDDNYIKTLKEAYNNCPKTSDLVILIAKHYQNKKEFDTANVYFDEAKILTDDSKEIDLVNFEQGHIELLNSNFEKAIIQYDKCINSNNTSIRFLSQLSLSYSLLKENNIDRTTDLIEGIDISELQFVSLTEDYIFLNMNIAVPISLPFFFKDFLQSLHPLESIKKTRLASKISFIKSLLFKEEEDYLRQIDELLNSTSILNYDFLFGEISEAIYKYFVSDNMKNSKAMKLAEKVQNNVKVLNDLSDYHYESIINHLFENNKHELICNFTEVLGFDKPNSNILFKLSYSYREIGNMSKAKSGYQNYLNEFGESNAVLNNLGNIFKSEGNTEKATELYSKAIEVEPDDKIAKDNLKNIENQKILDEEKEKEANKRINEYKASLTTLKTENKYVLEKLNNFVVNLKAEDEIENNQVAIPNYKFAVLMQTSREKAESLKDRFLEKKYIYKTNKRNDYRVVVYEINPLIEEVIKGHLEELNQVVEDSWIKGFEDITTEKLKRIKYFTSLKKIERINKKFSKYISRDFKELVFNYLIGNQKATIVLSGSMVEFLIIYYCEKKRIRTITYTNQRSMNVVNRNLYDSTLFELITYADENNLFGRDFPYLGNLLRVYRNLIHPGLELKNDLGKIDKSKLEISFIGAMEILNKVI